MEKENETLEFKRSLRQLKEGVISLSAMLNKHGEGTLYFGVDNSGLPVDIDIGEKTLSDVSHEIRHNLKPMPERLEIKEVERSGKNIVLVRAKGNDAPYSSYGRYYVRIDDGDILMTGGQLREYFERQSSTYSSWEGKPSSCRLEDLDEDLLIDTIRRANEKGRLDYVYRDLKEALNKLDLLDEENNLKTAGEYLFSKKKPILIKEASYPTDTRTEFGEIKQFRGNLFECLLEAVSYAQNHISYKATIEGLERIETPEIPVRAIREVLFNAFVHARYAAEEDNISVTVLRSSLRIYNPGPIYRDIDPRRFASGEVGSKIRNPLIASVLYRAGYIDAFGTGFDRTFDLCEKAGVTYEYHNDEFGFAFAFHRDPRFLDDKINDKINDKIKSSSGSLDEKIAKEIARNKNITIPELSKKTGKSAPTVFRHIKNMVEAKILKRIGSRKSGYWILL